MAIEADLEGLPDEVRERFYILCGRRVLRVTEVGTSRLAVAQVLAGWLDVPTIDVAKATSRPVVGTSEEMKALRERLERVGATVEVTGTSDPNARGSPR
jgi:hypothetical protein